MLPIMPESIDEVEERTGCSREVCEKVLIEKHEDITETVNFLLEETTRFTYINTKVESGRATMVKFKSQAEIVFSMIDFEDFSWEVLEKAHSDNFTQRFPLLLAFDDDLEELVKCLNTNVDIADVATLEGDELFSYVHPSCHYGAIISTKGASETFGVALALRVATSKCDYLEAKDIPDEVLEEEREKYLNLLLERGQSAEEAAPRVASHMRDYVRVLAFLLQPPLPGYHAKTMGDQLAANNIEILDFIRFDDWHPYSPYEMVQRLRLN